MANQNGFPFPEARIEETEGKEIVVRLVQNGEQVGGVNASRIWNNILNHFFAPQTKKPDLRSVP
jgi:hypothetical protein